MEEQLINVFGNSKLQDLIDQTIKQYHMSLEETINLKSLLLTVFLLTRKEETIYTYFLTITNGILKNHTHKEIISNIIDSLFKSDSNNFSLANTLIYNLIIDGYCYHSFNASFLDSIKQNGLVVGTKSWDNEELEKIRILFTKHGITDIFGLYQGRKNTPIFLANTLESSKFYAYSSPTWFRHFVSGGLRKKDSIYDTSAFFNRNYEQAINNMNKLSKSANLTAKEKQTVFTFFQKYWKQLATKEVPYVALVKRSTLEHIHLSPPLNNEKANEYAKRIIFYYSYGSHIINQNIPPENIIIFPYQFDKINIILPRKESQYEYRKHKVGLRIL